MVHGLPLNVRLQELDVNYWPDRKCARAFWTQCEVPPYRRLLADTAAWLDPAPGERWLDLGCGGGQLTHALWEKSGGFINDNSCIRPQTIIPNLPQEPKGFVDVFAKYRIG